MEPECKRIFLNLVIEPLIGFLLQLLIQNLRYCNVALQESKKHLVVRIDKKTASADKAY